MPSRLCGLIVGTIGGIALRLGHIESTFRRTHLLEVEHHAVCLLSKVGLCFVKVDGNIRSGVIPTGFNFYENKGRMNQSPILNLSVKAVKVCGGKSRWNVVFLSTEQM